MAQQLPFDWRGRTMTGGSYQRLIGPGGISIGMAALHSTHLEDRPAAPDFSGAVYISSSGGAFAMLDLGIGPTADIGPTLGILEGGLGVALFQGSTEILASGHVGVAMIAPLSEHTGIRIDAGRRWYLYGTEPFGLWTVGFGVTGLGRPKAPSTR